MWESLSQNHPLVDGNQRTAFAAAYTFLAINGPEITANAEDTYAFMIDLYQRGEFRFERLAAWLRTHTAS
jgi:death on curing protein